MRRFLPLRFRKSRRHTSIRTLGALETLERRDVFAGLWSTVANPAPGGGAETMMLLTDGTVMVHTGTGDSKTWAKLTPDASGSYANGAFTTLPSMNESRLYFPSTVLPSGKVHVVGGEYSNGSFFPNYTNTAEIFDPATNQWTAAATFPEGNFGDTPTSLLRDGRILAGAPFSSATYLYDPQTDSWSFAANKLRNDASVEESWMALPNGNVLSYDLGSDGFSAQVYDVASNTWMDTGPVPVMLTANFEIGAGLQLPDGRVFLAGASNQTALYDYVTNTWEAGPTMPVGIGSDDAPAVALPNGHILFVADTPSFQKPSHLYDFDPRTNSLVDVTPEGLLAGTAAFRTRLLILPNGHVLMTAISSSILEYTPDGTPEERLRPTISDIQPLGEDIYHLTGTRLNGYSEGAAYGDDAEMSSNYPIVQLTNAAGRVYYAKSVNWTPGLTTDDREVSTDFILPIGLPADDYQLRVIANGIASTAANFSTLPGLAVLLASPGIDATIDTPAQDFSIKFNSAIDLASLSASDFTVNGIPATSATWTEATNTVQFHYDESPIIEQGLQEFELAAGSIVGLDGSDLRGYQGSFRYDAETLAAVTFSVPPGSHVEMGSQLELVLTLSEPIDPTSVSTANLTVTRAQVTAAEILPGNASVRYTLQTKSEENDFLISVNANTFRDQFGNPAMIGLAANYILDIGTHRALPSLNASKLLGSAVYDTVVKGNIRDAADVDGFQVKLERGQILSADVHTEILSGLQLGIRAVSPSGNVLATSLADLDGDDIHLSAVRADESGIYRLEVFSINNTRGDYELTPIVNSDIETEFYFLGAPNGLPSLAQDLNPAFIDVSHDNVLGSQASVRGLDFDKTGQSISFAAFDEGNDGYTINNRSTYQDRGLWHRSTRRGDEPGHSPAFSFYYGDELTGTYATRGANRGSITSSPILIHPHGPITLHFNYILQTEALQELDEAMVEVSSDGGRTFTKIATSDTGGRLLQASEWTPIQIDMTSFAGQSVQLRFTFDTKDDIANEFEGWYVDDVYLQSDADWSDYYKFSAKAGERIEAVAKTTSGDLVQVDLENLQGAVLAAGVRDATNVDSSVRGYIAPTTGTYYVRVSADLAATYELLVTRDASLEREANNTPATATPLQVGKAMLGYVATELSERLDFQNSTQGVTINNELIGAGTSAGLWHLTNRRGTEPGHSGPTSFYYGQEATGNYNTGARNAGSLTTDDFHVPSLDPQLTFNYILRTQNSLAVDRASVEVSTDNFATSRLVLFGGVGMPLTSSWRNAQADLSAFAGQTVKVRFTFDTVNGLSNAFEGWYLDDIEVSNGQRPDWYSITLGADQSGLSVSSRTPGEQSEHANPLQLKLELYDSTGTVRIAEGQAAGDGHNQSLLVNRLTGGTTYLVKVSGQGETRGEYLLDTLTYRSPLITASVDDAPRRTRTTQGSFDVPREAEKGWTTIADPRGYQGDYTIHDRRASSGGGNYAEWTIAAPAASVELFASWIALPSNATNATYEVYRDSERLGQITIDQTRSPQSALLEDGTLVQSLGVFQLKNWRADEKLSVRLNTQRANGNVVADGIFIGDAPTVAMATTATMKSTSLASSLAPPSLAASTSIDPAWADLAFAATGSASDTVWNSPTNEEELAF